MRRKTVHKTSFPMFSWFFMNSLGFSLPSPAVASGIMNACSLGYCCRSKFSLLQNNAFGIACVTLCSTDVDCVTAWAPFTVLPYIHKTNFILGGQRFVLILSGCFMTHCLLLWHLQMSTAFLIPHPLLIALHPSLLCTWAHPQSTYKFLALPASFFQKEKTSRLNLHWKIS